MPDLETIQAIQDETARVSAIYEFFREEQRLIRSQAARVEFLTTVRYIERVLQPGDRILDLGAGTGIYSRHFARQGHEVTAVELAERNLELFQEQTPDDLPITLYPGNALDLSRFDPESFDVVLLMGPLYHLLREDDRNRCLMQARRVLKQDGTLFVAFINHDMIPLTESSYSPQWFAGTTYDHETFRIDNFPFVFFTLAECREMLKTNGLTIRREIASDGFSEILDAAINQMSEDAYRQYLRYHFSICEKPELLGATNHFLFECTQPFSPEGSPSGG